MRERMEEMEDRFEILQMQAKGPSDDAWPDALVKRLLDGEAPLKLWREFRKINLSQLSDLTGIAKGYLSEIENGKKPGSASTLKACAKALRVDMDDLVRG